MNKRTGIYKSIKRAACLMACLALVLVLPVQTASAAVPAGLSAYSDFLLDGDNYSAVVYNNSNGFPTPEANDIEQTSEGFIWIGCYSGLIRYDGSSFELMDTSTGLSSIASLFVDSQDRLWIGTNDSGLALMEKGSFRIWGEDEGISSYKVNDIAESSDGVIYAGTTAGVTMIMPDMSIVQVDDPKVNGAYIDGMYTGKDGTIYCLTGDDDILAIRDGKLVDHLGHKETPIQNITSIYPDPEEEGVLYLGTGDEKLYHGTLEQMRGKAETLDMSPLCDTIEIKEINDRLWVGTRNGIGMFDKEGFHDLSSLPLNNRINHVMEDYQGNLWFASSRQGLMKIVYNQFADVQNSLGLEETVINSTCISDGKLLIGTDSGLMAADNKKALTELPLRSAVTASGEDLGSSDLFDLLKGVRIRSILRDSKGRVWISTWRGPGLLRYEDETVTAFSEAEGVLSNQTRAICELEDGSICVACSGGISVIKGDKVVRSYGKEDGIDNTETLCVSAAANGDILVGSNGGGVYIIGKDGVRNVSTSEGLSSGVIMRIRYDSKRNIYWLITGNKLAYMSSDYKVKVVDRFPHYNNYDLFENSRGDMWITGNYGVCIVPADDLVKNKKITPCDLGVANGLPCTATSNSYSELTDKGDLYLSGSTGVVRVNIEAEYEDIGNLKSAIPFVRADGKYIYPDKDGAFRIEHDVQRLVIYPFVFNYSLTDPLVSLRLDGFDKSKATTRRSALRPVYYTNLRGGSYKFEMEIKDTAGRTSRTVSVPIIKKKALYERPWFYIIVFVVAAFILNTAIRHNIKRRMAELEAKHREETERERVQSELHMANQIQSAMLSHDFSPMPGRDEFVLCASMDPARQVGGDFYDFFPIDDDHLCLLIADVSGKGIPAALYMANSKAILQRFTATGHTAEEILEKANEELCSGNDMEMFVTVWLGILEISTGKLEAANAGHEYPAIRRKGGKFELLKDKHGMVLGGMEGMKYRGYELQLNPGDSIFVYTDGVPEASDADYNMFGTDRMLEALNSEPDAAPEKLLGNVRAAVDGFVGDAEPFDDLTMLCLEYKGV